MPSFNPVPLIPGSPNSTNLVLSDLIKPNNTWNISLIIALFDSHSVREIKKTVISSPLKLEFLWTPSPNGNFLASSAYRFISSLRVSVYSIPFVPAQWKQLWKLKLNARLKHFLWKIAWDIIPSKAWLKTIFPISPDDSKCPLCNMAEDSLLHLFFNCSFARIAWRSSFWPLIPKLGVLFPYLAGFKASSLLMLFLAFLKMMFTSFRSSHLCFVIDYGFAGTRPFMKEQFLTSLNLLYQSRKQLLLMQQPGAQYLSQKSNLGFLPWKVTTRLTLIQQSVTTFQPKLQSAEITQEPL
jgi:hypothetical protein